MSLNAYLTDAVKELPGFTSHPYKDGGGNNMKIDSLHLFDDKGRLYARLGDENSVVPSTLKDYVEEFSFYEWIPQVSHRETGIYRLESAEAEVEDNWGGSKRPMYRVKIIGKELMYIRDLFRMIKVGSIRPEESYEKPQQGLSRAGLEEKLAQALRSKEKLVEELRVVESVLHDTVKDYQHASKKIAMVVSLARTLRGEMWGLCRKRVVAQRITNILDTPSC